MKFQNDFLSLEARGKFIFIFLIILVSLSSCSSDTRHANADKGKRIEKPVHFHHIHLNATHPEATIGYYEKFFGGSRLKYRGKSDAVFTERSFILLDSVTNAPPSNAETSLWHIGWAGVDGHAEFNSRVHDGIGVQTPVTGFKLPHLPDSVYFMYFWGPDRELIEVSTGNKNHRFEHIHLLVSNIEASTTWFKNNLGLTPAFKEAINFYGVLMNSFLVDNVSIILFAKPSPESKSILVPNGVWPTNGFRATDGTAIDHIGFSYENIGPVRDRMISSGLQIVRDVVADTKHGIKSFFVRTPDSLLIEVVEEKPIPEGIWQNDSL